MLNVNDITVCYGEIIALQDVTLNVEEGELVTVIGINGAGKTTLTRAILGLVRVKSGFIEYMGDHIHTLSTREIVRKGISLCPERRRIFPQMTVIENLEMGAYLQKDKEEYRLNLRRVFEIFPVLEERKYQTAGTLSGGEQQMLAIARALMSRPRLLILDEPSLGLSPIMKEKIFENIVKIRNEGTSILLVEQDAYSALKIADRGYVLENGKIALSGSSRELMTSDAVKIAYLGI